MENNIKKVLSTQAKVFSIIIILAQIGLILGVGYLHAHPSICDFSFLLFFIPGLLLSVGGFITAILFLVKRKIHIISVILLLTSICASPWVGEPISQSIIPLFKQADIVKQQSDFEKKLQTSLTNNAVKEEILNDIRVEAETYFDDHQDSGYKDICEDLDIIDKLKKIYSQNMRCYDLQESYALSIMSVEGGFICADSSGFNGVINDNITGPKCQ